MKVKDIMTQDPACCTAETKLPEVARQMKDCDCGEIPVVENEENFRPIGVVTDRDIVIRALAEGKDPMEMTAGDCMSSPAVTTIPEADAEECYELLEENRIRRIPVVDQTGRLVGIVSQADVALHAPQEKAGEVLEEVSQPAHK